MLPLSDGLHPRRFPIVNVALIAANFAVWLLYELPHLSSAVYHASFYPCSVDNACHAPAPWAVSWFTAMRSDAVDRLVVLSSPAVAAVEDRPGLFYRAARLLLGLVMPSVVRDHHDQARLIEQSGLAWTIVRGPLVFTDGPHTGHYHAGPITRESGARISRADLADFMLTTATNGDFVRTKPLVSE